MGDAVELARKLIAQEIVYSTIIKDPNKPRTFIETRHADEMYSAVGLELLRNGRIAVLMLAGGLSTSGSLLRS